MLLECDDDEKADVSAEVVPSSQKDEENMKESASQEDVKLKTDVPVNFDLISSANDSNDKSGLAKKSVNISQVVSSVIGKSQNLLLFDFVSDLIFVFTLQTSYRLMKMLMCQQMCCRNHHSKTQSHKRRMYIQF